MFLRDGRDDTSWKALDEVFTQECEILESTSNYKHAIRIVGQVRLHDVSVGKPALPLMVITHLGSHGVRDEHVLAAFVFLDRISHFNAHPPPSPLDRLLFGCFVVASISILSLVYCLCVTSR